ncbi:hypothetical protein N658DRAFT_361278 [Parathielavia hyrcaniae]|uniref:Uncharacterized protein n=1 Tax=Parathielavia hyrcaniae TaxID=113614 RepID=A0AAN6PR58_9PEZI|nr:hypothetical protein N658DRAFT_361278 [Parathielavia hyrcaniae]
MQRGIENEFARLETFFSTKVQIHSAQANVDLGLFLSRYLALNTDDNLLTEKRKPSTPVVLSWYLFQNEELPNEIVSKTPSLHMQSDKSSLVIGWDATDVDAEIERPKAEDLRKKLEEEAERRAELE